MTRILSSAVGLAVWALAAGGAHASEAELALPEGLTSLPLLGVDSGTLLALGLGVCAFGLLFGLMMFMQLKNLSVHRSMREISELIYETCKTYLVTQGKF